MKQALNIESGNVWLLCRTGFISDRLKCVIIWAVPKYRFLHVEVDSNSFPTSSN